MKIWMKLGCMAAFALPLFCSGADASKAANWKSASSGKMTIAADAQTNSTKFTVVFPKAKKDRWAYPLLKIDKADSGATKLTFQIKVETTPKQERYKNLLVMLGPVDKKSKKNWKAYKLPVSNDFQTVTVDLSKAHAYANHVQIGLNFMKADKATFYIRDVKFQK